MMSYCASEAGCFYRTDAGYCGYTGYGCIKEILAKYSISDENIEKIADAVVKKLHQTEAEEGEENVNTD